MIRRTVLHLGASRLRQGASVFNEAGLKTTPRRREEEYHGLCDCLYTNTGSPPLLDTSVVSPSSTLIFTNLSPHSVPLSTGVLRLYIPFSLLPVRDLALFDPRVFILEVDSDLRFYHPPVLVLSSVESFCPSQIPVFPSILHPHRPGRHPWCRVYAADLVYCDVVLGESVSAVLDFLWPAFQHCFPHISLSLHFRRVPLLGGDLDLSFHPTEAFLLGRAMPRSSKLWLPATV